MAAVLYSIHVAGGVRDSTDRMLSQRAPVAMAATELVGNLNATLATLRGYLLTGNPQGKADRKAVWDELDRNVARFDALAANFANPRDRQDWAETKSLLVEFRAAQERAERIAFTRKPIPRPGCCSPKRRPWGRSSPPRSPA